MPASVESRGSPGFGDAAWRALVFTSGERDYSGRGLYWAQIYEPVKGRPRYQKLPPCFAATRCRGGAEAGGAPLPGARLQWRAHAARKDLQGRLPARPQHLQGTF